MRDNINYGTALLKSTVRYGAANLQDHNHDIQASRHGTNEDNKVISTTTDSPFTFTGLLVGGQEPEVGWNYIAKSSTPAFGTMIYDSAVPNTNIPVYTNGTNTDNSVPCYTLVWDNWDVQKAGQAQSPVYVALEFVNNSGMDFWGLNNMIRNGGTFYIIGKLSPDTDGTTTFSSTDRSEGITWPTDYALPPYNATTGETIKERRVFIQDYVTWAEFVIGATSLQKAYIAVPDLRASQISLGLSVNLEWESGLSFESVGMGMVTGNN